MEEKNFALLTKEELQTRKNQIYELISLYGKQSHKEAIVSVEKLQSYLMDDSIKGKVDPKDALQLSVLSNPPDIVITDVPYGNLVSWGK